MISSKSQSLSNLPLADRVHLIVNSSRLRDDCSHPEIAMAIAQNYIARSIMAYLRTPDFLVRENDLQGDLPQKRSAFYPLLQKYAESVLQRFTTVEPGAREYRVRVAKAACRKLDVAICDHAETFVSCPLLMGEVNIKHRTSDGTWIKAGIVVSTFHKKTTPQMEATLREKMETPGLLQEIERILMPFVPEPGPNELRQWTTHYQLWHDTAPLRDFEQTRKLSLFPERMIWPTDVVPPDYEFRIQPETMRSLGITVAELVEAGISPYIAKPFARYCESKQKDNLAKLVAKPLELAENHIYRWAQLRQAAI